MKTVYVEPAVIEINGHAIGTVIKVAISGSCEVFGTSANVWTNLMSAEGMSLLNKSLTVTDGITEEGINWAILEADVLEQLGLTKAANQNPEPVAPIAPIA